MYDFLKTIKLTDPGRVRAPKSNNPTGMTVRIFANGEVYPSQELVDKFNLEYLPATNENPSYGFDIVDSLTWTPLASAPRMILFGVTPKTLPKVDLFGPYRDWETDRKSVV